MQPVRDGHLRDCPAIPAEVKTVYVFTGGRGQRRSMAHYGNTHDVHTRSFQAVQELPLTCSCRYRSLSGEGFGKGGAVIERQTASGSGSIARSSVSRSTS